METIPGNRVGTALAPNSKNYTAPKAPNGTPKYKPTKEIFKVNDCILLSSEKKEMNIKKGKKSTLAENCLG